MAQFFQIAGHHEFVKPHCKSLPSFAAYACIGGMSATAGGPDKAHKDYVSNYENIANVSFGGMPCWGVYEQTEAFAEKVMPLLKAEKSVLAQVVSCSSSGATAKEARQRKHGPH